ncbi:hypothetical protein O181_015422 [Austropuccinia psidii MF-1]|uniref:Chromo domain-containing protein n=1 Tax=Austropuccinia psidii MF-1 TaxID=1389203 RepID=A0A9Q3GQR9_9BASI|nr:hypothetical protein [Austropuccinia psidii MF-1]
MIQNLEDMVRIFCAYSLKFKYCYGITHYWCTLLLELKLAYKTSIHSITNQTPAILEKGWNYRLPQDLLRKDLVERYPTSASFKGKIEKARKNAVRCMENLFSYAKYKWDKSHANPDFKVFNLVLVSTTNFNKIKGCKKLKYSFAGPFFIRVHHGENGFEVELSEGLSNKHPKFPVSFINPYKSCDSEKLPSRNKPPQNKPPVEPSGVKKITKVLKERKLRTKKGREYLVRYSYPTFEDKWLAEKYTPEATILFRRFRHTRNKDITKASSLV